MGIFTGLIMEVGRVRRMDRRPAGAHLLIEAHKVLEGTRIGDSIAVNGVDVTVTSMDAGSFTADVSLETISRSTLGDLKPNTGVNLERALGVGERLGGHIVQGHVDGVVELRSAIREGNAYRMRFQFPPQLGRYVALKGSVALDGVSLTVANLGSDWFEAAVIPHTWRETTLAGLKPGSRVNIEVDVLAKYVERILQGGQGVLQSEGKFTLEYLAERGY